MLLFSELQQASLYAPSDFWKKELNNASHGIFPESFNYFDGTLFYDDGNRSSAIPLSGNAKEASQQFINFCKKHGYDEATQTIAFVVKANESLANSWTNARKSIHRLKMMDSFVKNTARKYQLNNDEMQQLRNTITMGLRTRKINKDNIVVADYTVVEIRGLSFDQGSRKFAISSQYAKKIKEAKPKPKPKPSLNYSKEWLTYLENNARQYQGSMALYTLPSENTLYINTVNGINGFDQNSSNVSNMSSYRSSS